MRYSGKTGKSPLQIPPFPPAHLLSAGTFSMLFRTFPSTILPNFKTTRFFFLFAIFESSLSGLLDFFLSNVDHYTDLLTTYSTVFFYKALFREAFPYLFSKQFRHLLMRSTLKFYENNGHSFRKKYFFKHQ